MFSYQHLQVSVRLLQPLWAEADTCVVVPANHFTPFQFCQLGDIQLGFGQDGWKNDVHRMQLAAQQVNAEEFDFCIAVGDLTNSRWVNSMITLVITLVSKSEPLTEADIPMKSPHSNKHTQISRCPSTYSQEITTCTTYPRWNSSPRTSTQATTAASLTMGIDLFSSTRSRWSLT